MRAGVKTVLLPSANRKEVKDLPQEVKDGLKIVHVAYVFKPLVLPNLGFLCRSDAFACSHIWETIRYIWPEVHWPSDHELPGLHTRL